MAIEQNGQQPPGQAVSVKPVIMALGTLQWELIVAEQENAQLRQENERLQLLVLEKQAQDNGEVRT